MLLIIFDSCSRMVPLGNSIPDSFVRWSSVIIDLKEKGLLTYISLPLIIDATVRFHRVNLSMAFMHNPDLNILTQREFCPGNAFSRVSATVDTWDERKAFHLPFAATRRKPAKQLRPENPMLYLTYLATRCSPPCLKISGRRWSASYSWLDPDSTGNIVGVYWGYCDLNSRQSW